MGRNIGKQASIDFQMNPTHNWPTLLPINIDQPSWRWSIGSMFIVPLVGLISKFWMTMANDSTVYNAHVLHQALQKNYESSRLVTTCKRRPLITYSNHTSCMDDPLIWGALIPLKWQFNRERHRWSAAAAEVCFSKKMHSLFFVLGKTFPIVRGDGIYQPAMNYAQKILQSGRWIHFFPEGRVIPTQPKNQDANLIKPAKNKIHLDQAEDYWLKWGIARLIIEHVVGEGQQQEAKCFSKTNENKCEQTIDVLPIYHVGMDDVLPTRRPYIPRSGNQVTFYIRPQGSIRIDKKFLSDLFDQSDVKPIFLEQKRIILMKFLENELNYLGEQAKQLHSLKIKTFL